MVRGEAGIGKSVLLEYAAGQADRVVVTWARGVEADMELPYASLHQVCAPFLDGIEELPQPQRDALRVAFGTAVGDPPDRFLVGLAVLTLLTRASETRPVLVLVDDAQWLDQVSLQTLEFVARRLLAEPVAMAFAVRDPEGRSVLGGLLLPCSSKALNPPRPGNSWRALSEDAWRNGSGTGSWPRCTAIRWHCWSSPAAAAPPNWPTGSTRRAPRASRGRWLEPRRAGLQPWLGALPAATRTLLLTAAAEPVGDARLLIRAAASLHITPDAAPAKAAGLIEFGEPVRFRHPLVRSAVYHGAKPEDRRAVHRALADATDPLLDPDRRAWHAAQAADGPDEEVAAGLEQAADRARQRGGIAAEAVLLERAVEVTPDPWPRGRRALAAAEAHFSAAAPERATELAAVADLYPLSPLDRARLARLRARILFARSRSDEAAPLFLDAAAQFTAAGSPLARETYLEAISATIFAGRVHGLPAPTPGPRPSRRVLPERLPQVPRPPTPSWTVWWRCSRTAGRRAFQCCPRRSTCSNTRSSTPGRRPFGGCCWPRSRWRHSSTTPGTCTPGTRCRAARCAWPATSGRSAHCHPP